MPDPSGHSTNNPHEDVTREYDSEHYGHGRNDAPYDPFLFHLSFCFCS